MIASIDPNEFENKLLLKIKSNDKECINTIENNEKLIKFYYDEQQENIKAFIEKLNDIIITENKKDFSLIEKVLKHTLFVIVFSEFKESNILIRACQEGKKDALKWLLTMNINYYTQDKNGMTALMYAAENKELLFVVETLIANGDDNVHLADINGNNALFHAINNYDAFEKLLRTKIDVNHQNKEGDTVFILCCKSEINDPYHKIVKLLVPRHKIDMTHKNNEGKTGLTYLIKNGRYSSINHINSYLSVDQTNTINDKKLLINETSLYDLIATIDTIYDNTDDDTDEISKKLSDYSKVILALIKFGFNLNKEIDSFGNTLMMYFMMKEDYASMKYLLKYDELDLSIQNQLGISASYLYLFLSQKNIVISSVSGQQYKSFAVEEIKNHKTYDHCYIDPKGNNLLIHSIIRDDLDSFLNSLSVLSDKKEIVDYQNNQNETALIIASKLGRYKFLTNFFLGMCDINHQDDLGNTALYYAIKIKDKCIINLLAHNHADVTLKNKQGVSPMDLANELNEEEILKILNKPISRYEMEKKLKKSGSNKSIFSSLLNKKNTDEKLEEYVRNYQINNYQKEYDDLLVNPYSSYKPLPSNKLTELSYKLGSIYYQYYNEIKK